MTWAGWFLTGYLGVSAWMATAIWFHESDDAQSRGKPWRAGLHAVFAMWILPALLVASILLSPRGGRR